MEFQELVQQALAVRSQFASFEVRNYGREWTTEDELYRHLQRPD